MAEQFKSPEHADATDVEERQKQASADKARELPEDALIILPVRNVVMFPGIVFPLSIGRHKSVMATQAAVRTERPLGVVLQRDEDTAEPGPDELYQVGLVAGVMRYVTDPTGSHHVVCQGEQRFRIVEWLDGYPFMAARVERLDEPEVDDPEVEARMHSLRAQALETLQLLPEVPQELVAAIQNISSAGVLADMVAAYLDTKPAEKQEVLETVELRARLDKVLEQLGGRMQVLRISREISQQAKEAIDERQREYLLREQMRAIQRQLGESEGNAAEIEELREAIEKAKMPEEVRKQADKELRRLERMNEAAAEYSMVRTYLDLLVELPWALDGEAKIDIARAREILDADHYGLKKIKKRILEHLAVRKLNPEGKSPILCFVGPPGVGKTSLGQSIARALDRPFQRVALGGLHDESEIRGHRRTYVGAMPGNIVQALRKAGARNCVLMLDEIDKVGQGFHGDPYAALLEVLDPEQNNNFRDNYLGVPFDLSRVFFITTANMLDTIPGPVRDRMEIIELPGYTEEEKLQIALRYLVERQRKQAGLTEEQIRLSEEAITTVIRDYTREAGVRNLEREIGALCRHVAVRVAEGETESMTIGVDAVREILGPQRFEAETAMRTSVPGVATGLAWTPVGGDILFIEASRTPGSGKLILTGQLGDVMKESAQAALSLLKARAESLGVQAEAFEKTDIHVHVPAGATPKDGPSAGVAMFLALTSLFAQRTVRSDTAMTGEISLRGLVLPVGGIKEKVLAAKRAGLTRVMLPKRNRRDYEEIPEEARKALEFIWLENVDEALAAALSV